MSLHIRSFRPNIFVDEKVIMKFCNDVGVSIFSNIDDIDIPDVNLYKVFKGEERLTIWQFDRMMRAFGRPYEDYWMVYLTPDEYEIFAAYRETKYLLNGRDYDIAYGLLLKLRKHTLYTGYDDLFLKQFVAFAEIKLQHDMPHEEAIGKLYEALNICFRDEDKIDIGEMLMNDFKNISNIALNSNAVSILINLAYRYSATGRLHQAILITRQLIANREKYITGEEEKNESMLGLFANLSTMLGKIGEFKECVDACNRGMELCGKAKDYRVKPRLLYDQAYAYHDLGEEEQIYKPLLIRAYHMARGMSQHNYANTIKNDAEKELGIIIE